VNDLRFKAATRGMQQHKLGLRVGDILLLLGLGGGGVVVSNEAMSTGFDCRRPDKCHHFILFNQQ